MSRDEQQKLPSQGGEAQRLYTVRGDPIFARGHGYGHGSEVMLTDKEAESLGQHVFLGRSAPVDNIDEREGGEYVVAEGHNIYAGGKFLSPGTVLSLSREEARRHGKFVEPRPKK